MGVGSEEFGSGSVGVGVGLGELAGTEEVWVLVCRDWVRERVGSVGELGFGL